MKATLLVGWLAVALSAFPVEPSFAGPALKITPQYSLVDEPLQILVDGLEPGQEFTVRAVLRMSAQNMLGSYGRFRTDEKGQADIEKQVPQGGTYEQGGMGLLWSMTKDALPEDAKDIELPFPANVGDPYTVLFELEVAGHIVATARVERSFAHADIKAIDIHQDGIVARLYLPPVKGKVPAVVLVGGSEGGLETGAARAMLLASRGYAALAVAYFRAEGLPNQLASIPLETIQRACTYLSRLPSVDGRRIGVIGSSRGAELALLAASAFPQIKGVVAYSPSNAAWAAIASGPQQAAWTLGGRPVPFVPNPSAELIAGFKQMTAGLPPRGLQGLIVSYAHAVRLAEIPVERINGPILLISGADDRLWPSSTMADLVVARMKEEGSRYSAEHLSFPDAGHIINFPYMPAATRTQLGGTITGLAHADAESWKRVLAFLATTLGQPEVRR